MKYFIFGAIFIYLTNWQAVIALFKGSFFSKTNSLPYKNDWLLNLLKEKTGIEFKFKKAISDKYGAFSLTIPKNTIVFSSKIIDNFNKDQWQWVALHEAGHRVYRHGYKYVAVSLVFISLGIFILSNQSNRLINPLTLAIFLAPLYQQIARLFEKEADTFAARKMDNPEGMITANEKFSKATKSRIYKNDLLRTLFTPHISYQGRINIAREELESRNSHK